MKTNEFGEIIMDQDDLCDLVMQGRGVTELQGITVSPDVPLESLVAALQDPGALLTWTFSHNSKVSVPEFDRQRQSVWFMPEQYQQLDIAEHVLSLCQTQEQLQRVGQELLLYQERDLFDLLRYLKYLVDVMTQHHVIWGVGRGSSVASYVLYLLKVHRIDSMFYELDIHEFLR